MYLHKFMTAVLVVVAIQGVNAASAGSIQPNSAVAIERTLRTFSGQFQVEYIHNRLTLNDKTDGPLGIPDRPPEEVARLRSAIHDNNALLDRLKREGVALRDVVNAYQSADGSLTFYVR
jgi:hypothetical protein